MDVRTGKVMLVTSINLYQHRKKEETTYSYSLPAEDQQNSGDSEEEDRGEAEDQNGGNLILNISTLEHNKILSEYQSTQGKKSFKLESQYYFLSDQLHGFSSVNMK